MKLHRYVDHQRLHIVTKDVISLSISVLLLFRHYTGGNVVRGNQTVMQMKSLRDHPDMSYGSSKQWKQLCE